jgi:hypothetical protein
MSESLAVTSLKAVFRFGECLARKLPLLQSRKKRNKLEQILQAEVDSIKGRIDRYFTEVHRGFDLVKGVWYQTFVDDIQG